MDPKHLLTDVFETALELIKEKPGYSAARALALAEELIIKTQVDIMQGTIRANRANLSKMVEEARATGKPVQPRWANYDRRG
jgi:hypothetical protein